MVKVALLIGVSEYQPGLNSLPSATKDVAAMQQVLVNPDIGGFDQSNVTLLENPDRQTMAEAIEQLFLGRRKDDLVLFFFSGHGIKDDTGRLYLGTLNTRKTPQGDLIRSSALSATFIHESMERCRSRRQVIILDSCFSGAFAEGLAAKDDGTIDIREQLGGEGRAVLTSSSSTQYSFEQKESDLSIYTRFLIEGITTGAADLDEDEVISIDELHEYASKKVSEFQPAMKPEIYAIREGFKIRLTKVPLGDPQEKYRKILERYGKRGTLTFVSQSILNVWRTKLSLSDSEAEALEKEVLEPYRQKFRQKLLNYEEAFAKVLKPDQTVDEITRQELQELRKTLELRNDDTISIEAKVIERIKNHQQNLLTYEQTFSEELRQEYPLSETKRIQMRELAQQLKLSDADIIPIETRITAEVEKYQHNLEQYQQVFANAVRQEYPISDVQRNQLKSQQHNLGLTDVDIASVEAKVTTEIETYQQKLQQYETALSRAMEYEDPLREETRDELRQLQKVLELNNKDVAVIEERITAAKDKQNQQQEQEKYENKLQQYRQEFLKAVEDEYPLSSNTRTRNQINSLHQSLGLRTEDVRQIEQPILAAKYQEKEKLKEDERQRQHEEAERLKLLELENQRETNKQDKNLKQKDVEYQRRLKLYEEELYSAIEYGMPLSYIPHILPELRQLQETLGLTDLDVASIDARLLRHSQQNLSQSQIRQPGILDSKKSRRMLLLGGTALGLVFIFSTFQSNNGLFFVLGNSIILISSAIIAFKRIQENIISWRKNTIIFGSLIAMIIITLSLSSSMDCDYFAVETTWIRLCELREQQQYIFGLLLYLTSIFIGCW